MARAWVHCIWGRVPVIVQEVSKGTQMDSICSKDK